MSEFFHDSVRYTIERPDSKTKLFYAKYLAKIAGQWYWHYSANSFYDLDEVKRVIKYVKKKRGFKCARIVEYKTTMRII